MKKILSCLVLALSTHIMASEIQGNLNVTGTISGTSVIGGTNLKSDTINEKTSAAGVTVDSVLLKDNTVTASSFSILNGFKSTIDAPNNGADYTYSLPTTAANTSIATIDGSQTLTNKSLKDSLTSIVDTSDTSKKILFDAGGTASTTTTITGAQTANRVLTLPDATTTLVGTDVSQDITNKDIDGGTASDDNRITLPKASTATLDGLTDKEGTIAYDTTLGQAKINDGANWKSIGGGAGGTGVNYILDPNTATGGWAAGSGMSAPTTTTTTANIPQYPLTSSAVQIQQKSSAGATTDYVRYRFTLGDADLNKVLQLSFWSKSDGADGDFEVQLYEDTTSGYAASTRMQLSTDDSTPVSHISASSLQFNASFVATSKKYLEVRFYTHTVAASKYLWINNLTVGPDVLASANVVGPWTSYTAITYNGTSEITPSLSTLWWRRVGGSVEVHGEIRPGTQAGTSNFGFSLPSGITIDTTKIRSGGANDNAGTYAIMTVEANAVLPGILTYDPGTSTSIIYFMDTNGANPSGVFYLRPTDISGAMLKIHAIAPIAEWSTPLITGAEYTEFVSNSSTTDAADTTSFVYGPDGSTGVIGTTGLSAARKKRIRFQKPIQQTDQIVLQVKSTATGSNWIDIQNASYANGLIVLAYQNSVTYGIGLDATPVSSTDMDVVFGQYAALGSTFGGTGVAWTSSGAYRWRVKKVSSPALVGHTIADGASVGLLPANPTQMSNALATQLGLKQYVHGTTYNGGNAPTVTGTSWTNIKSIFIPYQTQEGAWRLKFNVMGSITSSSRTAFTLSVNGVTFKNVSTFYQPISYFIGGGAVAAVAYVDPNTSDIKFSHGSQSTTFYGASGDVELESKPTWAY